MANEQAATPEVGTVAWDSVRDRVGVVMATTPTRVFLRPQRGGREWETDRENVRALTRKDTLRAGVAAANARSRGHA
ncbi:hypothetical protein ACH427_16980 [Streptomyces sp. NPDC020379]|uniref:hypothetical protein n=1 Tax=Streptomyces sp. NPDC020379 TaxID=3365071 RepID=UPI00379E5E46